MVKKAADEILATEKDVGRRVRAKRDPEQSGTIRRVIADGTVIYVHWDYQQPQDAPYPTSPMLLEWEAEDQEPEE